MVQEHEEPTIDFASMMRRKERPLPKKGCSIAFFLFLALLIIFIIVMYAKYRTQQ